MASGTILIPKLTTALILETSNVPTTATSYSCNWSNYDLLIVCACQYGNIDENTIVTNSYFSLTTSELRILLYNGRRSRNYEVYQNGSNAVYIKAGQEESTQYRVRIYGIKLT